MTEVVTAMVVRSFFLLIAHNGLGEDASPVRSVIFSAHNGLGEDTSPVRSVIFSAHNGLGEDTSPVRSGSCS